MVDLHRSQSDREVGPSRHWQRWQGGSLSTEVRVEYAGDSTPLGKSGGLCVCTGGDRAQEEAMRAIGPWTARRYSWHGHRLTADRQTQPKDRHTDNGSS